MEIKIMLFGQLCDIAGEDSLVVNGIADTNELKDLLQQRYPALAASKYIIAIDKKMVQQNTALRAGNIVALMPPFSGG